jgi:hypothetical protein
MSDELRPRQVPVEDAEEDMAARRVRGRLRARQPVLNLATGGREVPASVTPEYSAVPDGIEPLAEPEANMRRASATLADAKAGAAEAARMLARCDARRSRLATRWAEAQSEAERVEIEQEGRENDAQKREAEDDAETFARRIEAAQEVADRARAELLDARDQNMPVLVKRFIDANLKTIEEQRDRAARETEKLRDLQAAFSKRFRPFRQPMIAWLDYHEREQGHHRSEADLTTLTNIPRPPIDNFELDALRGFEPLSPMLKLLLADLKKQEREAQARARHEAKVRRERAATAQK